MADAQPKPDRDRHPELSAPIVDLSLEVQIARAEQAVVDRGSRVRRDAGGIADALRSKRGAVVRWAAIAGVASAAGAVGYAGYRASQGRRPVKEHAPRESQKAPAGSSFAAEIAAEIAGLARIATQWALRLHAEQGVLGSIFGMIRSALRPRARSAPQAPPDVTGVAPSPGGNDDRS